MYKQCCTQAAQCDPYHSEHRVYDATEDKHSKLCNTMKMLAHKTPSEVHDVFRSERPISKPTLVQGEEDCFCLHQCLLLLICELLSSSCRQRCTPEIFSEAQQNQMKTSEGSVLMRIKDYSEMSGQSRSQGTETALQSSESNEFSQLPSSSCASLCALSTACIAVLEFNLTPVRSFSLNISLPLSTNSMMRV